ncbi:MAG: hypothetical protein ACYTFY_06725 [Planctomycetota bacterium]|jgi:hypothetical protein
MKNLLLVIFLSSLLFSCVKFNKTTEFPSEQNIKHTIKNLETNSSFIGAKECSNLIEDWVANNKRQQVINKLQKYISKTESNPLLIIEWLSSWWGEAAIVISKNKRNYELCFAEIIENKTKLTVLQISKRNANAVLNAISKIDRGFIYSDSTDGSLCLITVFKNNKAQKTFAFYDLKPILEKSVKQIDQNFKNAVQAAKLILVEFEKNKVKNTNKK